MTTTPTPPLGTPRQAAVRVDATTWAGRLERPRDHGRVGLRPGHSVRAGPLLAAAVVSILVVVGISMAPILTRGSGAGPSAGAPGAPGGGDAGPLQAGVGGGVVAAGAVGSSALPLTYAHGLTVGPGAGCCWRHTGAWTLLDNGGWPAFSGPSATSADPSGTFTWALGQPGGGHRWDQIRIQVWIPAADGGARVRYAVTTTNGGPVQSNPFDVPQGQYEGWYTLPATFAIGSPTERSGSAWVTMSLIGVDRNSTLSSTCANQRCRDMAGAQVRFSWS